MNKSFLKVLFSAFFATFIVFIFQIKTIKAQTCDPSVFTTTIDCSSGWYAPTGNCSFDTGSGVSYVCEYCRTIYPSLTFSCPIDFIGGSCRNNCAGPTPTCPAAGSPGGSQECVYYPIASGCFGEGDCPHPPDTVCDTYCTYTQSMGYNPGYCTQVDPACGTVGGGPSLCGNGVCDSGESNASCPGDCPPITSDFAMDASPTVRTINPGGATSYTITVSPIGNFAKHVNVSVVNCPPNATCRVTATTLRPPDYYEDDFDLSYGAQTGTVFVYNTGSTPIENYSITTRGVGSNYYNVGKTHDISPVLHIVPFPPTSTATSLASCPSRNVTISWHSAVGADKYLIYRNTDPSLPVSPLTNTSGLSYLDSPPVGQTYYYWVQSSHTGSGNTSSAIFAGSVIVNNCPSGVDIKANGSDGPIFISYGTAPIISWTSSSASSCNITSSPNVGSWSGLSGSQRSATPTVDTVYTAECNGGAKDSVVVKIPLPPSSPVNFCSGTNGVISWTTPPGYTQSLVRAFDNSTTWACGANQLCTGAYGGTNYHFSATTSLAMIAGHSYSWWVHTYEPNSGTYSNTVGGSFTCNGQAAFTINPTSFSFSGVSGGATPAGQTMTITNSGTATLNYRITTDATWCMVNGVDSTGSVTGTVGANSSGTVTVSVKAPSSVGSFPCTVTVSDPAASPTSRSAGVLYTVTAPPSVCPADSNSAMSISPSGNVASTNSLTLSWNAVSGATYYAVRLNDNTDSTYNTSAAKRYDDPNAYAPGGNCGSHYICEDVTSGTQMINVPVIAGHNYSYWVHPYIPSQGLCTQAATTFTVGANPLQAICDSSWRAIPGSGFSPSQPVGTYVTVSPNIANNQANVVVVRGGDNSVYYQSCNYSAGNPCVWNASYGSLGGTTNYPLFTDVPTFWNVYHYGIDGNTYLKSNTSSGWQGSWSNQGVASKSWGQPFRWTDVNNVTWQTKKNPDGTLNYYCTAPGGGSVCEPLNFVGSRSSVSTSTVVSSGTFTTTCDFDSSGIDAIQATVTGGGTCTFASWDKTGAVFNCTAGAATGSQTVTCSTASGTASNVCAQSNTAGNITVTAAGGGLCNASAVGTNQFVGCVYNGVSFGTLTSNSATNGQSVTSPADSVTAFNYTDITSGFTGVSNNFSIRWKGNFTFTGGTYIFTFGSDDGMRVYIDDNGDNVPDGGTYLVDDWNYQGYIVKTTSGVSVSAGSHRLVAEYFQGIGGAQYSLSWAKQVPPANPSTVDTYNSNTDPISNRTSCGNVTVSWKDNATNETGYSIYKDGALMTSRPASSPASATGGTMVYTFDPGDGNTHTYSIVATGASLNSAQVTSATTNVSSVACSAQLQGQSDKDLLSVNGNSLATSVSCNNKTDALPASTVLRYGDVITFQINLCNSGPVGGASSTNMYLFDTLTNLQKPSNGSWNIQFYNGASWSALAENSAQQASCPNPSPSVGQYTVCGTSPNQVITFNLSSNTYNVAPGSPRYIKMDAQIGLANTTTTYGRFQNKVDVCYKRFVGDVGTCSGNGGSASLKTPLILFYNGLGVPEKKEQP